MLIPRVLRAHFASRLDFLSISLQSFSRFLEFFGLFTHLKHLPLRDGLRGFIDEVEDSLHGFVEVCFLGAVVLAGEEEFVFLVDVRFLVLPESGFGVLV